MVFKGFKIGWPGLNPAPYGKITYFLRDSVSFLVYNMKIEIVVFSFFKTMRLYI